MKGVKSSAMCMCIISPYVRVVVSSVYILQVHEVRVVNVIGVRHHHDTLRL